MATITKRKDSYRIKVSCGVGANGKYIQQTTTYKPKATTPKAIEKEVQQYAMEYEKRVKEGKTFEGDKVTFYDVAMKWNENFASTNLTKGNREHYLSDLERKAFPTLANMKISSIKPIHLQSIFDEMSKEGYAPKTIRCVYCAISSVMNYAYRLEIIENNPLDRCKLPPIKKDTELHFFTLEQSKIFLSELDKQYPITYKAHTSHNGITKQVQEVSEYVGYRELPTNYQFKALFRLAIYGGFRLGEILALTWKDIDYETNTIHIRHSTGRSNEGQYIKEPKTKTSVRDVTLPQSCFDTLKEWYKQEKNLATELGTQWQGKHGKMFDSSFIFIQNDGKQMNSHTPYHKFKTIISRYNEQCDDEDKKLPSIRFHDLRHTSATLMLSENVDIETVSHRLGHSKASITLDVYGHFLPKKDKTASDKLEALFDNKD